MTERSSDNVSNFETATTEFAGQSGNHGKELYGGLDATVFSDDNSSFVGQVMKHSGVDMTYPVVKQPDMAAYVAESRHWQHVPAGEELQAGDIMRIDDEHLYMVVDPKTTVVPEGFSVSRVVEHPEV